MRNEPLISAARSGVEVIINEIVDAFEGNAFVNTSSSGAVLEYSSRTMFHNAPLLHLNRTVLIVQM